MRFMVVMVVVLMSLSMEATAETTRVLVRAVSRDAKIVGSNVGGARITLRDAATGRILDSGLQKGETGDTPKIMKEPRVRDAQVFDTPGAAHYLATIELSEPTVVEIEAEGPLDTPQATMKSSKTMLLVPGIDIMGEGVLLELHGFRVGILEPESRAVRPGEKLPVRASVTMACGCVTEPGGTWDSNDFDLRAQLLDFTGRVVAEEKLEYAGEINIHKTVLTVPSNATGAIKLRILAMDGARANFGIAELPLVTDAPR